MNKEISKSIGLATLLFSGVACQLQGPGNTVNVYIDGKSGTSKNGSWIETRLQVNNGVYLINGELAPLSDCSNFSIEQGTDMGGATAFDNSKSQQFGKYCK